MSAPARNDAVALIGPRPKAVKRMVILPHGKACGLGTYVRSWRQVKELAVSHPDLPIGGFDHVGTPAHSVLRSLRCGMHDRINRHLPFYGRGRKWEEDWQRAALQCAVAVNTPRLIVRWVPSDFRGRLHHRLHSES